MNRSANLAETGQAVTVNLHNLVVLALNGLMPMFHRESQLFCFRLHRTPNGLAREGVSVRYTLITLLGLHKAAEAGLQLPIDRQLVLNNLLRDSFRPDNLGDLGLLLWLCALAVPERLDEIYKGLALDMAISRYREVQQGQTMALAWFLTGLAYARLAGEKDFPGLTDSANDAYRLLTKNQGQNGIFGHLAIGKGVAGVLRSRLGSFADQVYPILAFSVFGRAFGVTEALTKALRCGEAICRAQGCLGEWWWHYDCQTGRVVGKYPVYAVHQHGMAPMALLALGDATGLDFSPWIYKGLQWITGRNDLNRDFRDTTESVIWRGIHEAKVATYFHEAKSLLGSSGCKKAPRGLRVNFECRPYELGWLLYAFAHRGSV